MRKSPSTRPIRPSIGITRIQRICPGNRASIAGRNITSQIPPRLLASGDCTFLDRNQRAPSSVGKMTNKKAPTPKNCNTASAVYAPTTPIQLRAACDRSEPRRCSTKDPAGSTKSAQGRGGARRRTSGNRSAR
jgi:hypothetical protein